jgi:hydantoinase/carbamoylase family amidase
VNRPIVDEEMLLDRVAQLASVGAIASGGVTRDSFSATFVEGRDLLAGWFSDAGLDVSVDAAGNLVGKRAGARDAPAIAIGSHLDTVINAGALDGAYGILGGLSAIEAIDNAEVVLAHPVVLFAFVNEEGARGTPAMTGSRAVVGAIEPSDLAVTDENGQTVGELLAGIGGDPGRVTDAAWAPGSIAAYLELHIEQGPILEERSIPVGIVTAITGRTLIDLVIGGSSMHAGTTPMVGRHDALAAAGELVLAIESLGTSDCVRVATTGAIEASPGSRNVVPGHVRLFAEVRDDDAERMGRALETLRTTARRIETTRGVSIEISAFGIVEPCPTSRDLQLDFETAALQCAAPVLMLSSGAGHDAQSFFGHCPIGMLFVPSVDGISHAPEERTEPADLARGATVLAHALIQADQRLGARLPAGPDH